MTIVSTIILQALRETNIIAITANPTPPEAAEGLDRLQSVILSVLGNEVGYVLEDWSVANVASITKPSGFVQNPAGFTVPAQARLACKLTAATTLNLDPQPQDGQRLAVVDAGDNFATFALTLNGNGRLIDGGTAVVLDQDLARRQWVYRSDQANWIAVEPLSPNDEMPFPPEFDDYFIIMTAMRLNPRMGVSLTEESKLRLSQQRDQLLVRYNQTRMRAAQLAQGRQGGI
jgi:hypothetical protein